jgi:hypothetical protein
VGAGSGREGHQVGVYVVYRGGAPCVGMCVKVNVCAALCALCARLKQAAQSHMLGAHFFMCREGCEHGSASTLSTESPLNVWNTATLQQPCYIPLELFVTCRMCALPAAEPG